MTLSPSRQPLQASGDAERLTEMAKSKRPFFESFATKIRRLLSPLRERPARREITLPPFHPIIFANGRDDDTDGIKAFLEGRPVMHAGKTIGNGDCQLSGLELQLRCNGLLVHLPDGGYAVIGGFSPPIEVVHVRHRWARRITASELYWNQRVRP